MKNTTLISAAAVAIAAVSCGPKENASTEVSLLTKQDSMAYAYGVAMGTNFEKQKLEMNADLFKKGIEDVKSETAKITAEEANTFLTAYFQEKQEKENEVKFAEAKSEGEQFLTANAAKEGVQTTASGLQYKIIKEGTGASPSSTDKVTVHYKGTLIDGTQFDSSYDRGEPATFPVNGVIAGWTEALQLMKEGATYELCIPYNLAYGERGAGQQIPPYSTLLFTVELIKVNE